MSRRIPRVRQHDATDCGAACLRSILLHYGRDTSIAKIRDLASSDRSGTNLLGLMQAAKRLNFEAKGVRAAREALVGIPKPAIAHLKLGNGLLHYVVIYRVDGGRITVMDPAEGRVTVYSEGDFLDLWTGALLLLVPGGKPDPELTGSRGTRILALLRPHATMFAPALLAAAAYTVLGLAVALYIRLVVDHVIIDGNGNLLALLSVGMLATIALQTYFGGAKGMAALRIGQKIDAVLLLDYYRHLLSLPQRFFDRMRVGEVIARMNDAVRIRAFISDALLDLIVNVLVVVFSFAMMFFYDWRIALLLSLSLPLYGVVLWCANVANRRSIRGVMERSAELESQLFESISAISTVKRFGLESHTHGSAEARLIRALRPVFDTGRTQVLSACASDTVSRAAVVVLFWFGGTLVIGNRMTPGELLGFYALIGYFTGPAIQLVRANRTVQDALIAADRLYEIMEIDGDPDDRPGSDGRLPPGLIRFERVSFRYGNQGLVLSDLDVTFARGEITAIVGPSGGGKSTVVALLQRLYTPVSGRITIGDTDIRNVARSAIHRGIACVSQEVPLFSGNVLENVVLDDTVPDVGRVLSICRDIGFHDFVDGLPLGYGTLLGSAGAGLSAGQRQKLAIARALYREPEILILDEASSNLDPSSEQVIQTCMERLRKEGRTIILVAHRLASAVRADRILVLAGGRVLEEGTHTALLEAEGRYAEMWRLQHPVTEGPNLSRTSSDGSVLPVSIQAGGGAPPGRQRPVEASATPRS